MVTNFNLNPENFRLLMWGIQQLTDKQIGAPDVQERLASLGTDLANQNNQMQAVHPTEEKFPEQCKFFRDTIEEMYSIMLKKNQDYSPYNIKVTGMRGLVTRLWDKSARFFSLMGLDIGTGDWSEPREPENESIDQNLIDWANYCIIARIFREGKWAK